MRPRFAQLLLRFPLLVRVFDLAHWFVASTVCRAFAGSALVWRSLA
jgi:hypothetical protein